MKAKTAPRLYLDKYAPCGHCGDDRRARIHPSGDITCACPSCDTVTVYGGGRHDFTAVIRRQRLMAYCSGDPQLAIDGARRLFLGCGEQGYKEAKLGMRSALAHLQEDLRLEQEAGRQARVKLLRAEAASMGPVCV